MTYQIFGVTGDRKIVEHPRVLRSPPKTEMLAMFAAELELPFIIRTMASKVKPFGLYDMRGMRVWRDPKGFEYISGIKRILQDVQLLTVDHALAALGHKAPVRWELAPNSARAVASHSSARKHQLTPGEWEKIRGSFL